MIRYLDGSRLYNAVLAGGNAVIKDKNYLNKINVFPVPDADTGTNLASTMRSIASHARAHRSLKSTLHSIADAALSGARGNSGLIFAQYVYGVSQELKSDLRASTITFGESVKNAVKHAYRSILSPVEGTMLTVIRDWAEAVYQRREKTNDFVELLSYSLQVARKSLRETPLKLKVLAKAGVVDAGAKGFVDFLEGVLHFMTQGRLNKVAFPQIEWSEEEPHIHTSRKDIKERYCSEALIVGKNIDMDHVRETIKPLGNSAIVAGFPEKIRIHIHTNQPEEVFSKLKDYGSFLQVKVDDMLKQYEAAYKRKSKMAVVVDSACDLPKKVLDDNQIHVIPVNLSFGDSIFLDKATITPHQFYTMLKTHKEHPTSSIPSVKSVQNMFSFLSSHYESVMAVILSEKLSGMFQLCSQAASDVTDKKIDVINSRNISVAQGLLVLRVLDALEKGKSHDDIFPLVKEWRGKTKLLVDIKTLKYMVRSGRVSRLKGIIARILNLKPIITLDEEGKVVAYGKSFNRHQNMKKIIQTVKEISEKNKIWKYAIVHAENIDRAQTYAEKLEAILGQKPAYIMDVSPAVGVHNGIGVVGLALMME